MSSCAVEPNDVDPEEAGKHEMVPDAMNPAATGRGGGRR